LPWFTDDADTADVAGGENAYNVFDDFFDSSSDCTNNAPSAHVLKLLVRQLANRGNPEFRISLRFSLVLNGCDRPGLVRGQGSCRAIWHESGGPTVTAITECSNVSTACSLGSCA
jgi:hypothetical protein